MSNSLLKGSLAVGTLLLLAATCQGQTPSTSSSDRCGEVVTVGTHDRSTTRYAFLPPSGTGGQTDGPITLALLAGGSGHLDLDEKGCPRALKGNSLVRSIPLFQAAGFGTALIDTPSSFQGEDGLGGFRIASQHAEDLGKVIADLRARTRGRVWIVGTSRGAISAVNAASRLAGPSAPEGVVLTSAVMSGQRVAKKAWVVQTVFDLALKDIHQPLLLVGHVNDKCLRSPPDLMGRVMERVRSPRRQLVTVRGGPGHEGPAGLDACEGRTPHGFVDQEAELAAGIARFVRGGEF